MRWLFRWLTNRACEHGKKTCYECAQNDRYFTKARGGMSRDEYFIEGTEAGLDARREVWHDELNERLAWPMGEPRTQEMVRAQDGPWDK